MIVPLSGRRHLLVPALLALLLPVAAHASRQAPLIDYTVVDTTMVRAECAAAVDECESLIEKLLDVPDGKRTFENTMLPLNSIADVMHQAFGRYAFMNYVAQDEALRTGAQEQEEMLNKYGVDLSFREDIYRAVNAYASTKEAAKLTGERKRLLDFTLRDYKRNGFGLGEEVRKEVQELQNRLVELGSDFEKTLNDWDDGIEVPPGRAGGLPESYLEGLGKKDNGNYWVSLDYPEFFPFMEMADDGELRKELTAKSWNAGYPHNVEVLEEAIRLRDRIAEVLGYDSWAAYRMEPRMAKDPETAQAFLHGLRKDMQPKLAEDKAAMEATYGKSDPDGGLDYWDWRYYNTKQKLNEYSIDQAKVSEYFPLQQVIDGLFDITQEMFGLRYVEVKDAKVWHPDVQLFEIRDAKADTLIAHFYTDLFPREGKFGHAAAFPLRSGGVIDGRWQTPVSAIVANMTKPTETRPSLLTFGSGGEVETLFHEYGHILHQTLTTAKLQRFAGSETEQDFVEAPSQNLEHWIWEPEVLARFAKHYETGEPLPKEMLDRMVAAKNLNSGIRWLRQVFYASLDLAYHGPGADKNTTEILRELNPICGFPHLEGTHMQAGFGHLFGYDAAYYGYLWSKVYGDDMYTAFEEGGILNPEVGMRYRREIYEKGGTLDGIDLLRNFLGREPNNHAFLRDLGLEVADTHGTGSH